MSSNILDTVGFAFTGRSGYSAPVNTISIGRVVSIELSDPAKLGLITYEALYSTSTTTGIAFPISNNHKHYPLKDEIVCIISGPSYRLNDDPSAQDKFYFLPYSMWMNSHHNKHPNKAELKSVLDNKQPSLEEVTQGVSAYETGQQISTDIVEKDNITTLKPYVGDITLEGRWGNTLRFGSTGKSGVNRWSGKEGEGDPITIITNGIKTKQGENWDLLEENINNDASSIWMTTSQEIYIKDIQENFSLESFSAQRDLSKNTVNSIPTLPTSYVKVSAAEQDRRNQKK